MLLGGGCPAAKLTKYPPEIAEGLSHHICTSFFSDAGKRPVLILSAEPDAGQTPEGTSVVTNAGLPISRERQREAGSGAKPPRKFLALKDHVYEGTRLE